MALTSDEIHDLIKDCKFYEDTIKKDGYYKPWANIFVNDNVGNKCIELEQTNRLTQSTYSLDNVRRDYLEESNKRGLPSIFNNNELFEHFNNRTTHHNRQQYNHVIDLLPLILMLLTFAVIFYK